MREIYALSPPLPTVPSHQGEVQTDTRTKDFFAYVKTEFDGKHDQVWDDVTSELVTEHGIVQVGMFGTLPLATMRELIAEKGGKGSWAATIECLSRQEFATPPPVGTVSRIPPSPLGASLSHEPAGETFGGHREARFGGGQLGVQLKKAERLKTCIIPQDLIYGALLDGVNFNKATGFIKPKEQTQICEAVWTWVVLNYANVSNCKILFEHLGSQIEDIVPRPYNIQKRWAKVLATFWENRRRKSAAARGLASRFSAPPAPPPTRPRLHLPPPPQSMYQYLQDTVCLKVEDLPLGGQEGETAEALKLLIDGGLLVKKPLDDGAPLLSQAQPIALVLHPAPLHPGILSITYCLVLGG